MSSDALANRNDRVRVQGYRVDTGIYQHFSESNMITWCLATYSNLPSTCLCSSDDTADKSQDSFITFIVQLCQVFIVAINTKNQLGEIVGPYGKSIETLGELLRKDNIGWNLAHDENLEVLGAMKSVFGHDGQYSVSLRESSAEWNHNSYIVESKDLADVLDSLTLESKSVLVARAVVSGSSTETDHWVLLIGLKVSPTKQSCILVRLEV
mmetsp:Transcript_15785/g.23542  ORF Transcript_15785/g.23542 Transcript_15785/m.23542 type:complete len:210 (-) Transcript_15785:1800-2429(-)